MTSREFQDRLSKRAHRAGITIPSETAFRLEAYYRLLLSWNAKINLTALNLKELPPEAVDRLLVEPLIAAGHVSPSTKHMMDVGSGGGSPAIPLALALPGISLRMVEAKTRKSVFLREALRATQLETAEVLTARFEELLAQPDLHESHDLVTVRAVRVEGRVLMSLQAFLKPGGQMFLFRGAGGSDTPETVTPPLGWVATYPLVESLRSRLTVLGKRHVGRAVPRETAQP